MGLLANVIVKLDQLSCPPYQAEYDHHIIEAEALGHERSDIYSHTHCNDRQSEERADRSSELRRSVVMELCFTQSCRRHD